jgi:hypothetical protein
MLLIMLQSMMKPGTEQKGGKMKIFTMSLFTLLLLLAVNTGEWLGYVLTIAGFLLIFNFAIDLEDDHD